MAELPPTELALEAAFRNAKKPQDKRAIEAHAEGLLYPYAPSELEAGAQVACIKRQQAENEYTATLVSQYMYDQPYISRELTPPEMSDAALEELRKNLVYGSPEQYKDAVLTGDNLPAELNAPLQNAQKQYLVGLYTGENFSRLSAEASEKFLDMYMKAKEEGTLGTTGYMSPAERQQAETEERQFQDREAWRKMYGDEAALEMEKERRSGKMKMWGAISNPTKQSYYDENGNMTSYGSRRVKEWHDRNVYSHGDDVVLDSAVYLPKQPVAAPAKIVFDPMVIDAERR